MKKNDITYEYRVFTNRLIDVESMEVGICTSKDIKEIKSKDKINGRFFHTSDTDEWFFCWNDELQKLNLKGDSDVNNALSEVKKLIDEANAAVSEAKVIANDAAAAAEAATKAAEDANSAVESIENKADKSEVDAVSQAVETKAEKVVVDELVQTVANKAEQSIVDELVKTVGEKANQSTVDELSAKVDAIPPMEEVVLKGDLENYVKVEDMPEIPSLDGYATEEFVLTKIAEAELNDKEVDLSNYATKEDISNFITKDDVPSVEGLASEQYVIDRINEINNPSVEGLATTTYVDEKVAEIKVPSIDNLATKEEIEGVKTWVNEQGFLTEHQDITGKQDVIEDLESIREGAAAGAVSEDNAKAYTDSKSEQVFMAAKAYSENLTNIYDAAGAANVAKNEAIADAAEKYQVKGDYALKSEIPSMGDYYTKEEINDMFSSINDLIGEATTITNTILA